VAAALTARGFQVASCVGEAATRTGILTAYRDLIARCGPGDAAALYYAGHGFATAGPGLDARGIVPVDYHASTEDDFRGITAWELSILVAQLTARTRNVTAILDCCHAARMVRDGALRRAAQRALPDPITRGLAAHLAALRAQYGEACEAVAPGGNPDAVRIAACAPHEAAYEHEGPDGVWRGALTEALIAVLADVGDADVSWAALAPAIRGRVQRRYREQRPELEGPLRRSLFAESEHAPDGMVAIHVGARQRVFVAAGALHGMARGDRYAVLPIDAPTRDAAAAIAELAIERVDALSAEGRIVDAPGRSVALPADAIAVPLQRGARRYPVAIRAAPAAREAIARAVGAVITLEPAGGDDAGAIATLCLRGDELWVEDPIGPVAAPAAYPDELAIAVARAEGMAVAQALRDLEGDHGVSARELAVSWGAARGGERHPLRSSGDALGVHERIYVSLRNCASRRLYAHVLSVGFEGAVELLTDEAPSGVVLSPGDPPHLLGERLGELVGLPLEWPPGVARTAARVIEVVVIVATHPGSVEGLTAGPQPRRGGAGVVRGAREDLAALILARSAETPFRTARARLRGAGFSVRRLTLALDPGAPPVPGRYATNM
jgi:hypothetical protein